MRLKAFWFAAAFFALVAAGASAQTKVLLGDVRQRPPEMMVDEKDGTLSGPLLENPTRRAVRHLPRG